MRVLHSSWSRRTKLAHAPGMTLEILRGRHRLRRDRGARPASGAVLVLGRSLDLVTDDGRGQEYRLPWQIGGWDYPPGVSDGVISDGTWGNLPPGEVYVVPQGGEGQIAINGSLPGKVLAPGEELILTFRDGRLAEMRPKNGPAARHLHETQIAYAERGGPDWTNLAEIGFGLNPASTS